VGGWPRAFVEEALAQLLALRGLAALDAASGPTHVALAGALRGVEALSARADALFDSLGAEVAGRWRRDRPLLLVAAKVRAARLDAAWAAVEAAQRPPGGA
jgi:hypothetical protein